MTLPRWPRLSAPASVLSCPSWESSWISTYRNNQNHQKGELLAGRGQLPHRNPARRWRLATDTSRSATCDMVLKRPAFFYGCLFYRILHSKFLLNMYFGY